MFYKGWVNEVKHAKTLKVILRGLSSTIQKDILFFSSARAALRSPLWSERLCTADNRELKEYEDKCAVVECVVDTLHLLVQAAWYVLFMQVHPYLCIVHVLVIFCVAFE